MYQSVVRYAASEKYHAKHKIHCTDTYQTRICLITVCAEPYSSPFDDRLWGPSSPLCSTATGVKARERWAGHKIPYTGEVQNS